jgi:hypothetical protein
MILTPNACKKGMPSIETLLSHSFFANDSLSINGPPLDMGQCYLKFPLHIKDQLKNTFSIIEKRLKDDQKAVSVIKFHQYINLYLNR